MTPPDSDTPRDDQRSLSRYRAAVAVLACLLIISLIIVQQLIFTGEEVKAPAAARRAPAKTAPTKTTPGKPAASPAEQKPVFVDLAARIVALTGADTHKTDYGEHYYRSPVATVHMHVIGHRQSCPLHIHRTSHETTVVVSGNPEVLHVRGKGEAASRKAVRYSPGTLISSPPFCGHKWKNHQDVMQGNLVFTSPAFDGNMFIDEDDARLHRGADPFVLDPDEALRTLAASGRGTILKKLPIMAGKVSLLTFSGSATVPAIQGPTVLYVTRGHGSLDIEGQHKFGPRHLTTIPARAEIKLSAVVDDPVAILLFHPEA